MHGFRKSEISCNRNNLLRMESTESIWLKSVFCEAEHHSEAGPSAKRMKFSDVFDELQANFTTMEFLVEEFQSLKGLKSFVPPIQSLHPVSKPTVAPMAILFKDEKYKDKTIEIMQALMEEAKLSGTPQVCN